MRWPKTKSNRIKPLEYLKNLKSLLLTDIKNKPELKQLTKEQTTKYRNQYLAETTSITIITLVFIGGITTLIRKAFQHEFFTNLTLTTIATITLINLIRGTKKNIDLIEERMTKRIKLNQKIKRKTTKEDKKEEIETKKEN